MGQGALNYQGVKSGFKLKDAIEEFKYVYKGQTIKAGDFVNFINGVSSSRANYGTSVNTAMTSSNGVYIQALELPNGSVFLSYGCSSTGGGDGYLRGIIVTVTGATINAGTETRLSTVK